MKRFDHTSDRKYVRSAALIATTVLLALSGNGAVIAGVHSAPLVHGRRTADLEAIPTIKISSYMFTVSSKVRAGSRVRVINRDDVAHTVTSDGSEVFNVPVDGHERRYFKAPTTPGRYPFHCNYHSMHGVLVVKSRT